MAKQSGGNTAQRVEALVRPTVEGMGLRLWDVVFEKEGPDWYLRVLIWDEENRLLAVDDNGFVSNYWYDADGERTVKTSGESDCTAG